MQEYLVLKPIRSTAGTVLAEGSTVLLTARQAKWMLLSGKVARIMAPAARIEPKTKSRQGGANPASGGAGEE